MKNKLIVITPPENYKNEIDLCKTFLQEGLEYLHIRKPKWNTADLNNWLSNYNKEEKSKMIIHHHKEIFNEGNFGGFHCAYSNLNEPVHSCAVHSFEETNIAFNKCNYLLLSPVYNSISKNEVKANEQLLSLPDNLKKNKLIALGGISDTNAKKALEAGYAGVATIGFIWDNSKNELLNYKKLKKIVEA